MFKENDPIKCLRDWDVNYLANTPNLITDNIFLGDYYQDARDKDKLIRKGITHILTCGNELETLYPSEFTYRHIKLDDWSNVDISVFFADNYAFIKEAIDKYQAKVFIHW